MQWFHAQGGQQIGPIDETEFQGLVRSGVVGSDTLVWREGMPNWLPLGALPSAGFPGYAPAPVARVHFGGFWIRAVARLIDGLILSFSAMILVVPLAIMLGFVARPDRFLMGPTALLVQGTFFLGSTAIAATYETYFVSTRGATPGKMALGLKVIRADGSPVPVNVAFGRYLAQMLSGIFMIGYIMAAFDVEKRALHDRICQTRVIRMG
jgi:uncharacterized RDD family membrane protein YckC